MGADTIQALFWHACIFAIKDAKWWQKFLPVWVGRAIAHEGISFP
jgi:hypothetical protein